uniref:sphingolipid 4-desaturase n=1 Tax=Haemonchus contortus TaxID=6289 RepID=A0A7I4Y767_HAECO|nr:Sphingolipid delta4-desaturase and Fatty acid desaturase domain containing protein [Haemonchus contortus]
MGQSVSRDDFIWTYTEQPHMSRRDAIVRAHPEVRELFGIDESFKFVVVAMVLFQVFMCWLLQDASWMLIFIEAYFCGGVINHAMTLAIHDISHNTVFGNKYPLSNRFFGMVANLPIGIPISISFKKYHVEHHRYLGEDGLDTDVPTDLEAYLFTTPARKFIWLLFQPLFYAFRPLIIYKKAPSDLELINAIIQIAFDLFILQTFGMRSLLYLILGTLVAMGVHPSAGHFISEHYVFKEMQETYSYYGPWNLCTFNVGYHVEHHDFPYIPGRNLPEVRKIAPEFYNNLMTHSSWTKVLWDFVFSPNMGPFMRLKRKARVPQNFETRHALLEYYQALSRHTGFEELTRYARQWLDVNNNKKNYE